MAYDDYTALRVDLAAGIATVTLDNPPINLFDLTLYTEMARLADELAADDEARVVVLRSANPDFFIAHFDVELILQIPSGLPTPTELHAFHLMCERFRTMPKATIAVVEGRVGGGGSELALSCDMRFAAIGRATFNQPEVALGILPGGSGTVRLARLVGRSRTMEVVLGCDDVDAELAERWGWVNRALPPGGAVALRRPARGEDRRLPPARRPGGQGRGAASGEGRRGRPAGRGRWLQPHARRPRGPGRHAPLPGAGRPDPRRRAAPRRAGG